MLIIGKHNIDNNIHKLYYQIDWPNVTNEYRNKVGNWFYDNQCKENGENYDFKEWLKTLPINTRKEFYNLLLNPKFPS